MAGRRRRRRAQGLGRLALALAVVAGGVFAVLSLRGGSDAPGGAVARAGVPRTTTVEPEPLPGTGSAAQVRASAAGAPAAGSSAAGSSKAAAGAVGAGGSDAASSEAAAVARRADAVAAGTAGLVRGATKPERRRPAAPGAGLRPIRAGAASRVDLARPALLPELFLVPAPRAGLAFDLSDGRTLWRQGATSIQPIASLTKLMTALLAVERFGPRSHVKITPAADRADGTHMGGLTAGRSVRVEVLLQGLMIQSGNDAAVALAIGGTGSEKAWVKLMNRRATLLGLRCTHYVDASGLDPRNRSCPADLAALAIRAMAQPRLRRIARKRGARVWPGAGNKITLRTTNHLLREHYPGAVGLKTGYTLAAGHCLVAIIQRGATRIGIVLLGSKTDAFADARRIARAAARAGVIAPAT